MPYTVTPTNLPEVLILQPKVFGDARGFFYESYNARDFEAATGLKVEFVQDNHSLSSQGVLRGLHYQIQHAQGKLVRVVQGEVFDIAVDLRKSSATFGQWAGCHLSAETATQLWVPPGFAHGLSFCTRPPIIGTQNMSEVCFGAILHWASIGLCQRVLLPPCWLPKMPLHCRWPRPKLSDYLSGGSA
jgi:dTDP-4-dehydrorhamnose 3,5-epimerase